MNAELNSESENKDIDGKKSAGSLPEVDPERVKCRKCQKVMSSRDILRHFFNMKKAQFEPMKYFGILFSCLLL